MTLPMMIVQNKALRPGRWTALILLVFVPTFLAGVVAGKALEGWSIGACLLGMVGAGSAVAGATLLVTWLLFLKRGA
jgi:hypothetical protein